MYTVLKLFVKDPNNATLYRISNLLEHAKRDGISRPTLIKFLRKLCSDKEIGAFLGVIETKNNRRKPYFPTILGLFGMLFAYVLLRNPERLFREGILTARIQRYSVRISFGEFSSTVRKMLEVLPVRFKVLEEALDSEEKFFQLLVENTSRYIRKLYMIYDLTEYVRNVDIFNVPIEWTLKMVLYPAPTLIMTSTSKKLYMSSLERAPRVDEIIDYILSYLRTRSIIIFLAVISHVETKPTNLLGPYRMLAEKYLDELEKICGSIELSLIMTYKWIDSINQKIKPSIMSWDESNAKLLEAIHKLRAKLSGENASVYVSPIRRRPSTLFEKQIIFLASLPGITKSDATKLLIKYKTPEIALKNIDDWDKIVRISKEKIKEIKMILTRRSEELVLTPETLEINVNS